MLMMACLVLKSKHKMTPLMFIVVSNVFQRAKDYLGLYQVAHERDLSVCALGLSPYLILSYSTFFVNDNYRRKFMRLILNDLSLSLGIAAPDFFLQYRCVKVFTSLTTSR